MPELLSEIHSKLADRLGELARQIYAVVNELRETREEIVHSASRAKRNVDARRKDLKSALAAHQESCRVFDQVRNVFVLSSVYEKVVLPHSDHVAC